VFGELPKIFGKEFLVGYFLPAALFVIATAATLETSGRASIAPFIKAAFVEADEKKLAIHLGMALLCIWAAATFLMVANFSLVRILEGYGKLNPARLLKWRTLYDFDRTTERIDQISKKTSLSAAEKSERRRLRMRLADEFPETRTLILPTRFGNTIRAFERYPQIIYNIEAIHSWNRLQAVLPDFYRASLDNAKAMVDFYVNLWFCALCLALFSAYEVLEKINWHSLSFPKTAMLAAFLGYSVCAIGMSKFARGAAAQWGELVKSAFDLYRGELCKQLGFELPRSIERERRMWAPICRTMIYRQARYADEFTVFRPLDPPKD
jgi:hypothetical protein